MVFDCSVRYEGECLNDYLLQGPDQTNKLVGVLTRFRQEKSAFMADVEQMFNQVKVKRKDQDFLRFQWRLKETIQSNIQNTVGRYIFSAVYRFTGFSNFALKRTADDYESEFGAEAADTPRRNFCVDDGLKSVATEDKAVSLVRNVKGMCGRGGFNLTKFVSNSVKLI